MDREVGEALLRVRVRVRVSLPLPLPLPLPLTLTLTLTLTLAIESAGRSSDQSDACTHTPPGVSTHGRDCATRSDPTRHAGACATPEAGTRAACVVASPRGVVSRPAPLVLSAVRGRRARVARTYSAEAPGAYTPAQRTLAERGDPNPNPNPSPSPGPSTCQLGAATLAERGDVPELVGARPAEGGAQRLGGVHVLQHRVLHRAAALVGELDRRRPREDRVAREVRRLVRARVKGSGCG